MAELDLKAIWKKGERGLSDSRGIDLRKSIGKSSKGILQKVKLILTIEFWLNNLITLPAAVIYFFYYGPFWGILTGTAFIIYFFYYLFLIGAIKKFDYTGDVKHSLMKIYKYLRFYVLHYKVMIWICFLGIPYLGLGYGFYIGYNGIEEPAFLPENQPEFKIEPDEAYVYLAVFVIAPILVAILFHYLVGLLYERRIKKLRRMINDLD